VVQRLSTDKEISVIFHLSLMDNIHTSLDIVAVEWVFSGICEMSLVTLSLAAKRKMPMSCNTLAHYYHSCSARSCTRFIVE